MNHVQESQTSSFQTTADGLCVCIGIGEQLIFCLLNLTSQSLGRLSAITRSFATYQIVCLNSGRAFVNGQNFGIAVVLRCTRFFNKAHTAMNLYAQGGHF